MKILLLGEFSSLHKNLKDGLRELGHDVTIASSGDGYRDVERDIDLKIPGCKFLKHLNNRLYLLKWLKMFKGYDVVQLINPFIFYRNYLFPNRYYLKKIVEQNEKCFFLAAGSDAFFWKYGRERLRYSPFNEYLEYDLKKKKCYLEGKKSYLFNKYIVDKSDGIIPIMYEYEISYKEHPKLQQTIPIPINIEKIKYQENKVGSKLVVFHGLTRYGFKGTKHVEKAFSILSQKYPDDLELIIDGNLPLNQYLKLMKRTNIVIDQTNSYSLGVNGVYALAMGKVVLGGAEPESLQALNVSSSPVINIIPDYNSIVSSIESLLENKNKILEIGRESRSFAERVHGHVKIAKQYLKTWGVLES